MVVIHIGLPKAGSATIQTFLAANEVALRAHSLDYPPVGRAQTKLHQNFVNEIKGPNGKFRPHCGRISDLVTHIQQSGCETTIISAEMFARCEPDEIAKLHQTLSAVGQEFKIVLIVRDLISQIPSSYGQKIRYGNHDIDFDSFFDGKIADGWTNGFWVAERWAGVFGWEAMQVRLLDPTHLLNGDLIDDVLSVAGLDARQADLRDLPRQDRVNESTGWKTLEAGRAIFNGRHGLPDDHPLCRALSAVREGKRGKSKLRDMKVIVAHGAPIADQLGWTADKGRYLTRPQAQACLDVFGGALRDLNLHIHHKLPEPLGLGERGFAERDFLPDISHIPAVEFAHYCDELGARLIESGLVGKAKKSHLRQISRLDAPPAA